jgi:hypothetical protein
MIIHHPSQIVGFHSCDREIGLQIINGNDNLKSSDNPWDWLGPGIYFWEFNPYRALQYAIECAKQQQKFAGSIRTPFIIGAVIELGNCLNLTEPNSLNIVKSAYKDFQLLTQKAGFRMPVNSEANRRLDCAVIKCMHESNNRHHIQPYDTIRSPFQEGNPIYPGANFTDRLHIEVCVRNPESISACFIPLPIEKFNPYLKKPFSPS